MLIYEAAKVVAGGGEEGCTFIFRFRGMDERILIHDLRHVADLACLDRVDLVIADPSRFDPRDDHRLGGTSQPLIMVPAQATAEEIGRILVDTPHLL